MHPSRHLVSERGFSMVELLVAMLIGLIGMIIIFQVFEVSEAIKRSTTSGGDAQQNGAIALYTMERDFKNAGMGFNDTGFVGCNIVGYDNKRATPNFPPAGVTMKVAPVFITSGAATTAPDQISVLYGSQPRAAGSVPLSSDMDATKNGADDLLVRTPFGYRDGEKLRRHGGDQDQLGEPDRSRPRLLPRRRDHAQPEIQPGRWAGSGLSRSGHGQRVARIQPGQPLQHAPRRNRARLLARLQLLRHRERQLDGDLAIPGRQRPTGCHLGRRQHRPHARPLRAG